jgi:hypothetical protein
VPAHHADTDKCGNTVRAHSIGQKEQNAFFSGEKAEKVSQKKFALHANAAADRQILPVNHMLRLTTATAKKAACRVQYLRQRLTASMPAAKGQNLARHHRRCVLLVARNADRNASSAT